MIRSVPLFHVDRFIFLIVEEVFSRMLLHVSFQLLQGLLDSGGVVTVEDGGDGLGDIGGEPGPLFPLLRLQIPIRREGEASS